MEVASDDTVREIAARILRCPFRGADELRAQLPHLGEIDVRIPVSQGQQFAMATKTIDLTVDTAAAGRSRFASFERWPVPVRARLFPPHQQLSLTVDHGYLVELAHHCPGQIRPLRLPDSDQIEALTDRPWHLDPQSVHAPGYGDWNTSERWVTLMPEFSVTLPLWSNFDIAEAGLSVELLDDLADWQLDFRVNCQPFEGWPSHEAQLRWASKAPDLEARLRAALEPDIEVRVHRRPVEDLVRQRPVRPE
jgi:hypothetical protein